MLNEWLGLITGCSFFIIPSISCSTHGHFFVGMGSHNQGLMSVGALSEEETVLYIIVLKI